MTTAPVEEVLAAIDSMDLAAPWADVSPGLRLVLPRRRPMPPGTGSLPVRRYPAGIDAGLGLDIGPAMLFVGFEQLRTWEVAEDAAFDRAEANVDERVRARRHWTLISEPIGSVPTIAFQSREGWASSLVLMPEVLCRILGERSGRILAPMRDLVMWMPLDTEIDFARWVLDEMAQADPNALDVPVLTLVDGEFATPGSRMPPGAASRTH
ncbi:hypothetical protein BH23CHL8_BH23CHL8_01580 [soil metagenome]